MSALLTIHLNNVHFYSKQGLHIEEGIVENGFKVDVAISYEAPENVIIALEETINYVQIYQMLQQAFSVKTKLLETLAMQLCAEIKNKYDFVKHISVNINKINPPITNFAGSVGVSYRRDYN